MEEKIKCVDCGYCRGTKGKYAERKGFRCEHPNQSYILEYFKEKNILKMAGFIGFGKCYADKPTIKTAPAWCPKKGEGKK